MLMFILQLFETNDLFLQVNLQHLFDMDTPPMVRVSSLTFHQEVGLKF
jgi:hypothetical protein